MKKYLENKSKRVYCTVISGANVEVHPIGALGSNIRAESEEEGGEGEETKSEMSEGTEGAEEREDEAEEGAVGGGPEL